MSHHDPEAGNASVAAQLVLGPNGKVTGLAVAAGGAFRVTADDFSLKSERVQGQLGPITLQFASVEAARSAYRFKHERLKLLQSEEAELTRQALAARTRMFEAETELRLTTEALLSIEAGESTHLTPQEPTA